VPAAPEGRVEVRLRQPLLQLQLGQEQFSGKQSRFAVENVEIGSILAETVHPDFITEGVKGLSQ
jgi:hypothetical protein